MSLLFSIFQAIKPTVLVGTSGVGKTFTKEVVEAMASLNPVGLPSLSYVHHKRKYTCIDNAAQAL